MDVDVTVTDDGLLAVRVDAQHWPPLPVQAVEALAARVPDARAAAERQGLTAAIRGLTTLLVGSGPDMSATVEVSPAGLVATVDDESYDRAQQAMGIDPDADGALRDGQVVVHRKPKEPDGPPEPLPT